MTADPRSLSAPSAPASNPRLGGARVGVILPSVNTTLEPEYAWLAPRGLSFHVARVMLRETTPEGLREMNAGVAAAAELVASVTPDVVAYACTSGSFVDGVDALARQIDDIRARVGCPVVATSQAMVDALRALGVDRLALATPYLDAVNVAERAFLVAHDFEVVAMHGLGLSGKAIREVPPERVADLVRVADVPRAQAIFVSCTDFRALEVVDTLERELGKPIVTSNQVTLWAILRALGRTEPVHGFGRLLAAVA